jgi:hypothetical protein
MTLFLLIDQVAIPIYIILSAMALWAGWRFLDARARLRSTYYELERDLARQRQWDALTWVAVFFLFGMMILGIQRSVVPFLQTEIAQQEIVSIGQIAQDGEYRTATPAPIAGGLDIVPVPPLGENNAIILLTPTLTPTPVGTIVPGAPAPVGCNDPRATLQIPANGMRVFQPITVTGTAFTEAFTAAKLEINGPSTLDTYRVIDERRQEAREFAPLSQFTPANYEPGAYQFRLTVFDITDTLVASCMVTIYITEPPITATPTVSP